MNNYSLSAVMVCTLVRVLVHGFACSKNDSRRYLRATVRLYYIVRFSVHVLFDILTYNIM